MRVNCHRGVVVVCMVASLVMGTGVAFAQAGQDGPSSRGPGVVVLGVQESSPAYAAGIRRGDVLIRVDKIEIESAQDLVFYVSRLKPGIRVELELTHGDQRKTVSVTLGDRDGTAYLGVELEGQSPAFSDTPSMPWRGQTPDLQPTVGARVTEVLAGSPAERAGLGRGDIIVSIAGEAFTNDVGLAELIGKHKPGEAVELEVRRARGSTETVSVTLGAAESDTSQAFLGVRYAVVTYLDVPRGRQGESSPYFQSPRVRPWPRPSDT